ncbi:hypothetical protein MMC07_004364 [Pseudocyphellaria aurata]|nr:hypothetical protein [Pseudocyphellaria aurata]
MSAPPSISTLTRDSNRELLSVLSSPSSHRPALAPELILQILSDPSRWIMTWNDNIIEPTPVPYTEDSRILLRTPPLTARSVSLLRKVVFTMRSHDQGWSSYPTNHGTYENTWTWFDAAVETKSVEAVQEAHGDIDSLVAGMPKPLDSPNVRRRHRIQSNRHAVKEAENYRITIDRGQEPLDDLKVGDQIMLIACARYPGWVNTIEAAGIEIWGEDDLNERAHFGEGAHNIQNARMETREPDHVMEDKRWVDGSRPWGVRNAIRFLARKSKKSDFE